MGEHRVKSEDVAGLQRERARWRRGAGRRSRKLRKKKTALGRRRKRRRRRRKRPVEQRRKMRKRMQRRRRIEEEEEEVHIEICIHWSDSIWSLLFGALLTQLSSFVVTV